MAETQSTDPQQSGHPTDDSPVAEPMTAASSDVEVPRRPDVLAPWGWASDWLEDWSRMFGRRFPTMPWLTSMEAEAIRVEQYIDGDHLVIRAELPGVDPDQGIDVLVVNDRLTISAHREHREVSKTDLVSRSEFHYGAFRRTVPLPPGTTASDVRASYGDGILEVRAPIGKAKAAAARVPVERKS